MYNNETAFEFEQGFGQESAFGGSQETYEFNQEFLGETHGETFEMQGELHETQEMELAHELLSVSNEEELNMFLGKLIRGAGRAIGNFARSPIGKGIFGALRNVAKTALPFAGKALGSVFGGPIGGMIGGKLGSMASNLFELELEGLSPEDREFEVARAYIRFASAAANNAANLAARGGAASPQTVLKTALTQAAQQHAPGLLRPARQATGGSFGNGAANRVPAGGISANGTGNGTGRAASQGTWTRRGNTLVIQL